MNLCIDLKPGAAVGIWRPTPTGANAGKASGAGPQFASMTPWVLTRPSQFRLPPPYASDMSASSTIANALSSPDYVKDYNELKSMGVLNGSSRTDDQTQLAHFWAGNTALFWNRIARDLSMSRKPRPLTLTQNAHLFALLNVPMADAGIACWTASIARFSGVRSGRSAAVVRAGYISTHAMLKRDEHSDGE